MPNPTYDLDSVRRKIPILRTHIPMNNCSQAPQSEATRAAADAYLTSWAEDGMDWDTWMAETDAARAEFNHAFGIFGKIFRRGHIDHAAVDFLWVAGVGHNDEWFGGQRQGAFCVGISRCWTDAAVQSDAVNV